MESKHIKKEIFLGFNAYTESDADIFKGRDADIEHLYDLVSNKDYVLCYAESGEGKSSLLDAGLTPRLRTNRYFPVKIAFTDEEYNNNNIVFDEVIKSRIMEAVGEQQNLSFVPKSDSIFNEKYSNDLWWFLRNNTLSLYGISFTIVLIFDQFEEVINYPKSDAWTSRFFAFLEKISSDDCPQYILDDINATVDSHDDLDFPNIPLKKNFKAIFSIRTEYIGELDYWCMQRYFIPDLKHNRFCLKPLTLQGADEVMRQYEGFDAELRDSIKDVLLRLKNKDNRTADDNNVYEQYIPALILSIVCTSLYQNSNKVFTNSLIADSIENFYNDKIKECNISLEERNTIASVLVDKDKRVRVASDCSALEKIKFNKKYKDALLRNRLIKKSNVNGVEYIELVHDSLIDVVKKHKEEAIQKELRKKRRRNVAISFLSICFLMLILSYFNVKMKEKELLRIQVKYITSMVEKLFNNGNFIDAERLLCYLSENNYESNNIDDFEYMVRTIYCNDDIVDKLFFHEDVDNFLFSPSGKYLFTQSDSVSKIWLVETGECLHTIIHDYNLGVSRFSSDERMLISTLKSQEYCGIRLWGIGSGECSIEKMLCDDKNVNLQDISMNGKYVFIKQGDTLFVNSVDTYDCLWKIKCGDLSEFVCHDEKYICISYEVDKNEYFDSLLETAFDDYDRFKNILVHEMCKIDSPKRKYMKIKVISLDNGDCIMTFYHENINSVVFSLDGKYLVTLQDNTSKLWSIATGECLYVMKHDDYVNSVAFSPDGRYIVTASNDYTSRLWSVVTGDCISVMKHDDYVNSAEFSPNGEQIVTSSNDGTSKLWSAVTGECVRIFEQNKPVEYAMFSPNGKYLLTKSYREKTKLFDVITGNNILDIIYDMVDFVPNGDLAYIANDAVGYYCRKDEQFDNYLDNVISNSSDDRYAVTRYFNEYKLWDLEYKVCLWTEISDELIYSCVFSPDNKYLITLSYNNQAKLWDVLNGVCLKVFDYDLSPLDSHFSSIKYTYDGNYVMSTVTNAYSECHVTRITEFVENNIRCDTFMSSYIDAKIILWDVKNENVVLNIDNVENHLIVESKKLKDGYYSMFKPTISPNNKYITVLLDESNLQLYNTINDSYDIVLKNDGFIHFAEFSMDGNYIMTISDGSVVSVYDVNTGELLFEKMYDGLVYNAELSYYGSHFTADSEYIMISVNNSLKIIDFKKQKELLCLYHDDIINYAKMSPDGNYITTVSNKITRSWDVKNGNCILTRYNPSYYDLYPFLPLSEIIDKWSEMLGPNAELTEEEKARYFLN